MLHIVFNSIFSGLLVLFSCLLWLVNKKLKEIEERRLNPEPQLITKHIKVLSQGIKIPGSPVLHINLWLSNPGDNPIYLKELEVEKWPYKELLTETSKIITHDFNRKEHPENVILPRSALLFWDEFALKDNKKNKFEGEIVLGLRYISGTKERKLKIQDSNIPNVYLPSS